MYLLHITDKYDSNWSFSSCYYEYDNEKMAIEAARDMASKGVECVLYKPYKAFKRPKPTVEEVNL